MDAKTNESADVSPLTDPRRSSRSVATRRQRSAPEPPERNTPWLNLPPPSSNVHRGGGGAHSISAAALAAARAAAVSWKPERRDEGNRHRRARFHEVPQPTGGHGESTENRDGGGESGGAGSDRSCHAARFLPKPRNYYLARSSEAACNQSSFPKPLHIP